MSRYDESTDINFNVDIYPGKSDIHIELKQNNNTKTIVIQQLDDDLMDSYINSQIKKLFKDDPYDDEMMVGGAYGDHNFAGNYEPFNKTDLIRVFGSIMLNKSRSTISFSQKNIYKMDVITVDSTDEEIDNLIDSFFEEYNAQNTSVQNK